jgi:hypothetical protein
MPARKWHLRENLYRVEERCGRCQTRKEKLSSADNSVFSVPEGWSEVAITTHLQDHIRKTVSLTLCPRCLSNTVQIPLDHFKVRGPG